MFTSVPVTVNVWAAASSFVAVKLTTPGRTESEAGLNAKSRVATDTDDGAGEAVVVGAGGAVVVAAVVAGAPVVVGRGAVVVTVVALAAAVVVVVDASLLVEV